MTMTLASLQMALEEYPDRLQRALTRQSRAKTALKRIKEQIEEAEAKSDGDDESGGATEDQKLRASYEQKKAQLELEVRRNPQDYGFANTKPTEGTIRAILQTNEELSAMKEQLQQLEHKRYGEIRSARMMRINRDREPKTTDSKLMAKLYEAEEESANADIEVQVLQETLDTYRMLTVILAGAKPVMNTLDIG